MNSTRLSGDPSRSFSSVSSQPPVHRQSCFQIISPDRFSTAIQFCYISDEASDESGQSAHEIGLCPVSFEQNPQILVSF